MQGATGSGTATVRVRLGVSLCYTLTVNGLKDVTAAHIHRVSTSAIVVVDRDMPAVSSSTIGPVIVSLSPS